MPLEPTADQISRPGHHGDFDVVSDILPQHVRNGVHPSARFGFGEQNQAVAVVHHRADQDASLALEPELGRDLDFRIFHVHAAASEHDPLGSDNRRTPPGKLVALKPLALDEL